ncbi:MAG: cupredoxin domain-containing protein [Chloroflexota bacterium]
MKKFSVLMVLVLAMSLVLTACGGSKATTTPKVDMVDFAFEPTDLTVPAGQEITMTLVNNGAVEHEYVIMKFGQTIGDDFGDEDEENIYWEAEVEAGQTDTVTFTAPTEPGEYQVVCGIEGHFVAGMVAKLIVVAP